jgi:PAS domain S-box-containing protein
VDIEPQLRLFSEQTTEFAVLLLDPAGRITWCNETAARIFGYSQAALTGLSAERLFVPEDVSRGVPQYEFAVARLSSDMANDRWLMRADGSRFWAIGATTALRNKDGELVGYCKALRDRTDISEQLDLLRNRAEALVKAGENKNVFLATLSHELRNPLAPLVNALQLIRMSTQDTAALQYPLQLIDRQIDVMRRLLDDLLDVTRISAGKVELQMQNVDLRMVLARAVENVLPMIDQRQQSFAQHLLQTPMIVRGDPTRLEQVFVNLLTNAAKYTPSQGAIELRATLDKAEAIVHVSDNGAGIAKEMQPHIFDLFTQVAAEGVDVQGGIGIGLSVVKNLVDLHGGSVQVRSDGARTGSEFTVRLPLASSDAKSPEDSVSGQA